VNKDGTAVTGDDSEARPKGKMKSREKELFLNIYYLSNVIHCKGKVIPLQARCGPEGG